MNIDDAPRGAERGSLSWYWNRLRVMHPAEMVHRVATAAGQLTQEKAARLALRLPPPDLGVASPAPWLAAAADVAGISGDRAVQRAELLLAGAWQRLDGRIVPLELPAAWTQLQPAHENPDVRHLMELHRHAHLVPLAQAFAVTGDDRYRQAIFSHLGSWFEHCPCPDGTAWASALDAGLRLVNWSIVWQLTGARADAEGSLPAGLRSRWLDHVVLHAHVIQHNLSRYSSANNHLIGELVGLVAADATWPHWPRLHRWAVAARCQLHREALRQNAPDGSNREQASWYQAFVFELLAIFVRICEVRGTPVAPAVRERLAAMARFAAALRNANGELSHHGDADHATACGLAIGHDDAIERMLGLAVAMDLDPALAPLLTQAPQLGHWLVGGAGAHKPAALHERCAAREALPRRFDDGGHYLLGSGFGSNDEVMMTLDAGPIGYLGIAAHGHADALSLRLSVAGRQFLVDRGTGTYNTEPPWRRYFRGTLAHNTVCLNGTEQSRYGGPFLWMDKARCTVRRFESSDAVGFLRAMHNGYQRLPGEPVHTRTVQWNGESLRFTVTDSVTGHGPRDVAIAWHFAPECTLTLDDDGQATVSRHGVTLRMHCPAGVAGTWSLHCGDADSFLGWHSPHLGVRVPAPSLVWRAAVKGAVTVTTLLQLDLPQARSP